MVAHLPRHERIPWPRPLRMFQKPVHKLLGGQRAAALKVGLFGAYLGRGAMLLIASWVIQNRWLLLLGGLYLIKLAADHLGETPQEARITAAEVAAHTVRRSVRGFSSDALAAENADVCLSLDKA